ANTFRCAERVDRPFAVVACPTTFAWELIGVQQSQRIGPGRNSSAYCFRYGSNQSLRQSARGSWKSQNVRARVRTSSTIWLDFSREETISLSRSSMKS